jgi:hypothetical protein
LHSTVARSIARCKRSPRLAIPQASESNGSGERGDTDDEKRTINNSHREISTLSMIPARTKTVSIGDCPSAKKKSGNGWRFRRPLPEPDTSSRDDGV